MNHFSSHLPPHEWLIVILFCALLCVLGGLAYSRRSDSTLTSSSAYHQMQLDSLLKVQVEGAVDKPGVYHLPKGSLLKDAVALAEPILEADLSILKTNRRLQEDQTLVIPHKKWITIYIEGAVRDPGPLQVVKETRYEDLLEMLDFLPEADQRVLRKKKRVLREDETVQIPVRQLPVKRSKKPSKKHLDS